MKARLFLWAASTSASHNYKNIGTEGVSCFHTICCSISHQPEYTPSKETKTPKICPNFLGQDPFTLSISPLANQTEHIRILSCHRNGNYTTSFHQHANNCFQTNTLHTYHTMQLNHLHQVIRHVQRHPIAPWFLWYLGSEGAPFLVP